MSAQHIVTEYPKALYPSADQRSTPLIAASLGQEEELRAAGFKPLAEWWAETGVPDCEPDEWLAKLAAKPPAKATKPGR